MMDDDDFQRLEGEILRLKGENERLEGRVSKLEDRVDFLRVAEQLRSASEVPE